MVTKSSPSKAQNQPLTKAQIDRDEFYKVMGEFYDPVAMKRHSSPTKRLIAQKNSTFSHKALLHDEVHRQGYGLHYTSAPGKSYVIEPKEGELPYDMVHKDPNAFYDLVMNQDVLQHKVHDVKHDGVKKHELTSEVTQRAIGRILKSIY